MRALSLPRLRAAAAVMLASAGLFALAACDAGSTASQELSVVEVVEEEAQFSILEATLRESGLRARLEQGGPYTLFAPTDVAFRGLGGPALARLRSSDLLADVVGAHIVEGEIRPENLRDGDRLTTLAGAELEVRVVAGRVTVGGVDVRRIASATNGFVFGVDVLLLDHLTAAERLSISGLLDTFRQLVERAGLADELSGPGPFTLFIPIDDAFSGLGTGATQRLLDNASLRERLLTHHLVRGHYTRADLAQEPELISEAGDPLHVSDEDDVLRVEGVEVLLPDVEVANGVIHLLGSVITSNLDVTEVAALAGLDLWVDAAQRTGLASTLAGEGPFTVFAPHNNAFVSAEDVAFLDQEGVLPRVAQMHVVPGHFSVSDVREQTGLPTLEGTPIRVMAGTGGEVLVGRSVMHSLVRTDLLARNGVVHVISQVIDPPMNVFEAVVFERRKRFVQGLHLAGLAGELATGGPYTVFAPTETAWNELPSDVIYYLFLSGDFGQLETVLGYHIAIGTYEPDALPAMLPTLEGSPLWVVVPPQGPIMAGPDSGVTVPVFHSLLQLTNGTIYRAEGVLFPPGL